ncbi:hypothetical protein K503DRAFT_803069 [Rhizopogon vinicolor AM-OR11-026]|uniref:Uncharacterized protein n=1 Tax=Rhizopogon vinicolor AM-OR11-026 TaxID=1314800 RepID=A0A1B7MR88_9AGAM|nr:hypothetical protein K503DRAFT_803069 [Rhizopogon vinicolor AM-OR11-026]
MGEGQEVGMWNPLVDYSIASIVDANEHSSSYLYVSGQAWPSKKRQYQFFAACLKPKSTGIFLKPNVASLVANFAFPQFTRNASIQAMLDEHPIEYVSYWRRRVRKLILSRQRRDFVPPLSSHRTKMSFFPIPQFVNAVLHSCILVISMGILQHLSEYESYTRLAREGLAQQNEAAPENIDVELRMSKGDDDKVHGAMGVDKTIGTVVWFIDSRREILGQVQVSIIPIIRFTLENKLSGISALVFVVSDAVDFLDEILPSLDNFASHGTDVLKARLDYRQKVLGVYPRNSDNINGCNLAESMLLNLHDHIDYQLQDIIAIAADHIDKDETSTLLLANLEILIIAVLNASAALHFMDSSSRACSLTAGSRDQRREQARPCARQQA